MTSTLDKIAYYPYYNSPTDFGVQIDYHFKSGVKVRQTMKVTGSETGEVFINASDSSGTLGYRYFH